MDFTCVIIAGSSGERMHPLSGSSAGFDDASSSPPSPPNFLLPSARSTPLALLVSAVTSAGIPADRIVLAVAADIMQAVQAARQSAPFLSDVTLHSLPAHSGGSADALRSLCGLKGVVPKSHHLLLVPADLVLESPQALVGLCETHRSVPKGGGEGMFEKGGSSVTMLLSDVGAEDEHMVPVKESKKGKLGMVVRKEEDIEFLGLATSTSPGAHISRGPATPNLSAVQSPPTRVLFKQSKVEIDEEEENVGETPKVLLSKSIVRAACTPRTSLSLRTDLLDLHAYVVSPWVWTELIASDSRKSMMNFQTEIIPLLIARQTHGYASAFGTSMGAFEDDFGVSGDQPFSVNAHILPRNPCLALRVCTVPNYLYVCREAVTHAIRGTGAPFDGIFKRLSGTVHAKDNSLLGENVEKGSGGAIKNSTVGKGVKIGNKCKINNCVIFDNVEVANGCILQNSVICEGVKLGENCNFNNVQVAAGVVVEGATKTKDEVIDE